MSMVTLNNPEPSPLNLIDCTFPIACPLMVTAAEGAKPSTLS